MVALLSASLVAGCKKEQSTNQNSAPVSYQVTDRLQVNNEDGKPRPLNTLPAVNDEAVAFGSEALSSGQVALKTSGGNLLLKVAANNGGNLTLAQTYAAAAGFAGGTVYYALKNN